MDHKVSIRLAATSDLSNIQSLNLKLFEYEHPLPGHDTYNLDWTYGEKGTKYFTDRINQKLGFVLVAETDQKILGYISVSVDTYSFRSVNPIAEIENMFVLPDYRRQKIGTQLVQAAIAQAKKLNVHRFKVEAVIHNQAGLAFYRSLGFTDFNLILEQSV